MVIFYIATCMLVLSLPSSSLRKLISSWFSQRNVSNTTLQVSSCAAFGAAGSKFLYFVHTASIYIRERKVWRQQKYEIIGKLCLTFLHEKENTRKLFFWNKLRVCLISNFLRILILEIQRVRIPDKSSRAFTKSYNLIGVFMCCIVVGREGCKPGRNG